MPPVEWIDPGYQGYGSLQLKLVLALGFDIRFGLFAFSPLLLLALAPPLLNGSRRRLAVPNRETTGIVIAFSPDGRGGRRVRIYKLLYYI